MQFGGCCWCVPFSSLFIYIFLKVTDRKLNFRVARAREFVYVSEWFFKCKSTVFLLLLLLLLLCMCEVTVEKLLSLVLFECLMISLYSLYFTIFFQMVFVSKISPAVSVVCMSAFVWLLNINGLLFSFSFSYFIFPIYLFVLTEKYFFSLSLSFKFTQSEPR